MQAVIEELERRELLSRAIDAIIDSQFIPSRGTKLRRGQAQEKIFAILGVCRNNVLCDLVNDRMRTRGYECIINRGNNYYRNVSLLPNQCA